MKYIALIEEIRRCRDLASTMGKLVVHTQMCPTCGAPPHCRCLSLGMAEPMDGIHAGRAALLAHALKKEILDVSADE